jgi:uncharacterized protein YigE (DUF2233 family)
LYSIAKSWPKAKLDSNQVLLQYDLNKYDSLILKQENFKNDFKEINKLLSIYNSQIFSLDSSIRLKPNISPKLNDSLKLIYSVKFAILEIELSKLQHRQDSIIKKLAKIKKASGKNDENILLVNNSIQLRIIGMNGSGSIIFKGKRFNFYISNLLIEDVKFHWIDPKSNMPYTTMAAVIKKLKDENQITQMVTNGGMFLMDQSPQGLFIEKGTVRINLDTIVPNKNNFYLKPNGVFYIDAQKNAHIDSTEAFGRLPIHVKKNVKYATQSGPMVLINHVIHKEFVNGSKNAKIRSGVGVINAKRVVFLISVDETNFYDFSVLFKDIFKCENALFLDGAISMMYLHDLNPNETGGYFGPIISVSKKGKH